MKKAGVKKEKKKHVLKKYGPLYQCHLVKVFTKEHPSTPQK